MLAVGAPLAPLRWSLPRGLSATWQGTRAFKSGSDCRHVCLKSSNSGALTLQIAESIREVTGAEGVGVIIEAEHMCMIRGVEKQNSVTKTSAMLGSFREDAMTREKFLSLLNLPALRGR